jgi:hypothetical protein
VQCTQARWENGGYIMIADEFKKMVVDKTRVRLISNSRYAVGTVADVDGSEQCCCTGTADEQQLAWWFA